MTQIAVNTARHEAALKAELLSDSSFPEKLYALQYLLSIQSRGRALQLPPADALPNVDPSQYRVLQAYAEAMIAGASKQDAALTLRQLSELAPPPAFANFALSLYYMAYPKDGSALKAAMAEVAAHPSQDSRALLVELLGRYKRYSELRPLLDDPNYDGLIPSLLKRDVALNPMDWPLLIKTLLPVAYEDMQLSVLALALLAGASWASLLLRFNGPLSWRESAVQLALPALLLGAASAHMTILAIYWQEEQLGLARGDDLIGQAIYCFAGIGLREELLKLLCFVPLIPFLAKRKDELEIFVLASLVGLGFAIEENIGYFESSQGLDAVGRFVTANFLHLSLTGVCGLTLTQAILYRGSHINTAVSTFGLAVLAHGAYDAFIIVPELAEYNLATMVVFILITYQYFTWIRHLRNEWRSKVSLTAHFTLGLTLVFGASYLLVAWESGPVESFLSLTEEALGLGILLVLFYREIPEDIY
ncbi:PrsW family glutamic-type intramembrane protease [Pelagicoccus enzymogenes]|uniref:PrsW family glutamic-type intramembrane protease n=1 Tax=Pelagicoccus enzymogenes TaxID=2773457 RepID=UPI00280C3FB4|nr:PrsW family glutamic-type intramembrane protease [Pelagicoccus enzymogenes]MDQ8199253.1 PrsW family glutamic-type intramembrane protease [Pelagicoccus enzymogenes]